MKKWIYTGIAIAAALLLMGAAAEQAIRINQFGGLLEDTDPLALPDGMASESNNVITDLGTGLESRDGYIAYATEPAKALWVFAKSNGTRYVIAHSSNSLKADSGSKTFAIAVSTVAAGIITAGAQLGDYFYFCNTVDGLKRWDGTTTSVASAAMTMDKLVTWKGRLVGAGKPGSERTLFLSRYLNGTDWSLEVNPTDDGPAQITVGGALDENIQGLYSSFKDLLMWFKNNSFGGLYGSRRSNFILRTFSETVGTNHPATVRDCDGVLRFLGPRRTVWEFDGTNIVKISEGNNALFENILNGESNTRTTTITSESDYEAGTIAGLSTSISAGDIMLSTWSATDTTADDFGAGVSFTNVSTITSPGSIALTTQTVVTDGPITNSGFEDGSGSDATAWTEGSWIRNTALPHSGTYHISKNETSVMSIIASAKEGGPSGSSCGSLTQSLTSSYTQYTVGMSGCSGKTVVISFSVNTNQIYSNSFVASGDDLTFYARIAPAGPAFAYLIDTLGGDVVETTTYPLNATGSFVSRSFDSSALSSAAWTPSAASWTTNGHTIVAKTQSSSDGLSWDAAVNWTTGTAPTSTFKRYIRYQIDFSTTSSGTGTPYVSDVTLSARQSSGTYVSDTKSIGTSISSWNVFQRDETLNDGTIVYGFYTDTDTVKSVGSDGLPVVGTFTSSQTITNNTIPTVSTASFAFVSAKFNITNSTQNPTNSRLSITWNEGSSTKAKGLWTNQRYWLATSLASASTNDTVFVYDRRRQWQKHTGFNVDDLLLFNQYPLFSNTSGIWQGETGTSDNGAAISSSYTTKYFFPVGPEARGYLRELWMTTTNSDATLGTSIYYDGAATPITLGSFVMNEREGYQVKKLPVPISGLQAARHAAIRWTVSGTERWKLLNGSLYFDPDTQRE